jgi:hypothetical protein
MTPKITGQFVQIPSWQIHVCRRLRKIEHLEEVRKPHGMNGENSSFASCPEKSLDTSMTEALDHLVSVAHHASDRKTNLPACRRFRRRYAETHR